MARKKTKTVARKKAKPGTAKAGEAGMMTFFEDLAEKSLPKEEPAKPRTKR